MVACWQMTREDGQRLRRFSATTAVRATSAGSGMWSVVVPSIGSIFAALWIGGTMAYGALQGLAEAWRYSPLWTAVAVGVLIAWYSLRRRFPRGWA